MDRQEKKSSVPYGAILGALLGGAGKGYVGHLLGKELGLQGGVAKGVTGLVGAIGAGVGGWAGNKAQQGDYEGAMGIGAGLSALIAAEGIRHKWLPTSKIMEIAETSPKLAQALGIGVPLGGYIVAPMIAEQLGSAAGRHLTSPEKRRAKEAEQAALLAQYAEASRGKPNPLGTMAATAAGGLGAGWGAGKLLGPRVGRMLKGDEKARKIRDAVERLTDARKKEPKVKAAESKAWDTIAEHKRIGIGLAEAGGALLGGTGAGVGWYNAMDDSDKYKSPLA
jgi:hypothetical protein